jgi:uncharacterized protein (DUF1778 family)
MSERKIIGRRFLVKVTGAGCGRGRFVEARRYLTPWRCQAKKFEAAEEAEAFRATLAPAPEQTTKVELWEEAWHEELPDYRWAGCPKIAHKAGETPVAPPAQPVSTSPAQALPAPPAQAAVAPPAQGESWSSLISLRVPTQRLELIDRAAQVIGKTRTEFLLESATRAAVDALLDRRLFFLDDAQYKAFQIALDAPPPNTELAQVLAARAHWER